MESSKEVRWRVPRKGAKEIDSPQKFHRVPVHSVWLSTLFYTFVELSAHKVYNGSSTGIIRTDNGRLGNVSGSMSMSVFKG